MSMYSSFHGNLGEVDVRVSKLSTAPDRDAVVSICLKAGDCNLQAFLTPAQARSLASAIAGFMSSEAHAALTRANAEDGEQPAEVAA